MKIAALGVTALLTGCATVSSVATLAPGVYTVSVQDVSTWGSPSQVIDRAAEEADDYCGKQGKTASLVNTVNSGRRGILPLQNTIVFRCEMPRAVANP